MTVYLNHTNKYLYILAVVYILEFGHNPFRKMVIINFGGGCRGQRPPYFLVWVNGYEEPTKMVSGGCRGKQSLTNLIDLLTESRGGLNIGRQF